jgi:peptidoglycan/xylan/chitin deacetylase (PgdA/CDA1 family)
VRSYVLNFHGIGHASRPYEPGERRYWLTRQELADVLDLVQAMKAKRNIDLTVDDGNESDYAILAPELVKRDLTATFFVLAGKFDQPGYLRRSEVRELALNGFEIGSHGLHHVDWVSCDDASLQCEVDHSRKIIEDVTGRQVIMAAAPFGSYDRRVLSALGEAGYRRVFSSDGGPRLTDGWPIPRRTLRTNINVNALADEIDGFTLGRRVRSEIWTLAKSRLPGRALRSLRAGRQRLAPQDG